MSCDLHFDETVIEEAWQQANKLISKGVSLLLLGETGAGKGEFVKARHQTSKRKPAPIVTVNCSALPKDLIESELFDYAPDAFTDANNRGFIGKIRQADGGVLFLDEIAEMPLQLSVGYCMCCKTNPLYSLGLIRAFKSIAKSSPLPTTT